MPTRKSTRKTSRSQQTKSVEEISYETKLTIVILLLLFVYPLGLVFMWVWMKSWPVWLKLLISLPLVMGLLAFFIGVFFIAMLIRHAMQNGDFRQNLREYRNYEYHMMTTPPPSLTPELSPTSQANTNTY